jgi:hypothetical protein
MNRRGLLHRNKAAGCHITPETVDAYLVELSSRVGSVTVQRSIYKLRRACELIDPALDLTWLADIEKNLAMLMRPSSKFNRWVLTEVLVEAGLTLITKAEKSNDEVGSGTSGPQWTDGRTTRYASHQIEKTLWPGKSSVVKGS